MNEYVTKLGEIEKKKQEYGSQNPTPEIEKAIDRLNSEAYDICEKYLKTLAEHKEKSLSALKAQEDDLRKVLFNLRMRQTQLIRDTESEAYLQNGKQIKVVRRELARIKMDIRERGNRK